MSGGFDSLGLMPELVRAVAEMEWNLPTDVQDEAIPLILGGGDVMVASETGSGKTAAFSLPMIQCVHERIRDSSKEVSVKTCASASIQIKLNINDKDSMCDILENGHACYSGSKNWCGCRATHGVRKGRCYYEALIRGDGICRVGWSTMAAHYEIGKDKQGYGFGGTSKKSFNSTFVEYGSKFGDNDVIGCSIDLDCNPGTISFSKNGVDLGVAFEIAANLKGSTFFPAIVCKGAGVRASFGGDSGALKYPPKSPYVALGNMCANNPSDVISSSSKSAFDNHSSNSKFKSGRTPLAIIVEPSLELAHQVYENMNQFVKYVSDPNLLVSLMVGGDGKHRNTYSSQNCDIVIGTPGKLNDMVKREALDLSKIK